MEKKPSWLTPTVLEIAKALAEKFDKSLLPILADALEEAGYLDKGGKVLPHMRAKNHVPNCCWVAEAIADPKTNASQWRRLLAGGGGE